MNRKLSAVSVTVYWSIIVLVSGFIIGILANSNASGGEQTRFTSIVVTLVGTVLINIFFLFFSKSNNLTRYLSFFLIVVSLVILYPFSSAFVFNKYDIVEETTFSGLDRIDKKIEYYKGSDVIRSESYWKNEKEDSIWIVYDNNGKVIKKENYRNGKLLERRY